MDPSITHTGTLNAYKKDARGSVRQLASSGSTVSRTMMALSFARLATLVVALGSLSANAFDITASTNVSFLPYI